MNAITTRLFMAGVAASTLFTLACGGSAPQDAPAAEAKPEPSLVERTAEGMVGHWVSLEGEVRPAAQGAKSYLKRDFTNTRELAAASLIIYSDDTFTSKNMTLVVSGPYTLQKPSEAVPGAVEADFSFTGMKITPHSEQIVGFLNSAAPKTCGESPWKLDVEQDVTPTGGCSVLGVDLSKYKEYDLVKVENDQLFYGARPADGSAPDAPAKRPTSLQVPLKRAN